MNEQPCNGCGNIPDDPEVIALKKQLEEASIKQEVAANKLAVATISWARAVAQFVQSVDEPPEIKKEK